MRWTQMNTEGFTDSQLETLNNAQEDLEWLNPDIDPKDISDFLNNIWEPGATSEGMVKEFMDK